MPMKADKSYLWYQLNSDGLLKYPDSRGPYYSKLNVNQDGPWSTEEEAVAAFLSFSEIYPHQYGELELIASYSCRKED